MSLLKVLFFVAVLHKVRCDTPSTIADDGHCIWYDTCVINPQKNPLDEMYLNCKYDGPSINLTDAITLNLLQETCPELADEAVYEDGTWHTCCSPNQITDLKKQLVALEAILIRCPSCLSNFRKDFCFFACHPRHSKFLIADELYPMENETEVIYSVTQYMGDTYVNDAYDSCENVYYPDLNDVALRLLCGPWGVEGCSPYNLFNYFGNNDLAPFNITYIYSDEIVELVDPYNGEQKTMEPLNPPTIPCNSSEMEWHCLCSDCFQSCPAPPTPEPPKSHIYVGNVLLYTFLCILFGSLIIATLIILAIICGVPGYNEKVGYCTGGEKISANLEMFFRRTFERFGKVVAGSPGVVISFGLTIIILVSLGSLRLQMTTDPVELWASPTSRTRLEKDYYDESFGPFYRTNQIVIAAKDNLSSFPVTIVDSASGLDQYYTFGPVFDETFMLEAMDLQLQIMDLIGIYKGHNITLNNICVKPLSPQNNECLIQSVMNYWQNDPERLVSMMTPENPDEYARWLLTCTGNPTYVYGSDTCMGTYGGPVLPYVGLGGFLEGNETISDNPHYEEATALVMTFIVKNYANKDFLEPAMAWEKSFLDFMNTYNNPNMSIAYYAERSIEDEIKREGKSDISTILISYTVMFAYVTLSLGSLNCGDTSALCIETKLWLGFCSVLLVFLSFISAVGFCALIGIQGTLFVLEVIPFLVLAVGVDNVFLLVQTWQREKKFGNESVEDHVARIVGLVAPSMLLATMSETVCFFLGAITQMPAVRSFALYAGFAILINFTLQLTVLVAMLTLDARRIKQNRYDIICCLEGPAPKGNSNSDPDMCFNLFNNVYAPFLLNDVVRVLVLVCFTAAFFTGLIFAYKVDVGLEQDVSMPKDSYVIKYFDYLNEYLSVGPPVYFVVKDYDFTHINNQDLVCGTSGCQDDSFITQIFVSSLSPDVSSVATGVSSWLDSYFTYISDNGGSSAPFACCRLDENGDFIDSSLAFDTSAVSTCVPEDGFYQNNTQRPLPQYFMPNLPYFLQDNPHDTSCPTAGHPAYGTAVNIVDVNRTTTEVKSSYFMAYHTILKHSADFTSALEKVYDLTDTLQEYLRANSTSPDVEVFPYSLFYVYYEQYMTMWAQTGVSIAVSISSVYIVLFLLSGFNFSATNCNIVIVIMILVDLMGIMTAWNIQLNAISLVNLVMATGISVEFCSHITHAFVNATEGTKKERARKALAFTGSSVFSGITLTKFAGILVLGFANSQLIKVFYFRMYLMIVVLGALHGLILLPVILSIVGPNINPYLPKTNTGIITTVVENVPSAFDQAIQMKVQDGNYVDIYSAKVNEAYEKTERPKLQPDNYY